MSLNKEFKEAIIDNNYRYSVFDGKQHKIEDLQICHILSKSKRTLNSIKKAYNCSNKTAEIIMNMPLLNTVVGTIQDNKEYKKTDDIIFIDAKLCIYVIPVIYKNITEEVSNLDIFKNFWFFLLYVKSAKSRDIAEISDYAKNIQHRFHKEIDLYI